MDRRRHRCPAGRTGHRERHGVDDADHRQRCRPRPPERRRERGRTAVLVATAGNGVDEPGAATLIEPGASVALSAGTATQLLATVLSSIPRLTVVTNSLRVAAVLHEAGRTDLSVVLTGGERISSDALVGPVAVAALAGLHVDWLLMDVHGIHHRARRTAVMTDSSTWGVLGLSTIAALEDADVVVTDDGLDPDAPEIVESACGRVVLARPTPTCTG